VTLDWPLHAVEKNTHMLLGCLKTTALRHYLHVDDNLAFWRSLAFLNAIFINYCVQIEN
jgi:hypothetical protein